jgi:HSP20 family protein
VFRSLIPFGRYPESRDLDTALSTLQRQMNRMFEDTFRDVPVLRGDGKSLLEPSMDVKETDKAIEIEAELPGVDEKDVEVTFEDGVLTVKGEKRAEKEEKKAGYYMSERSYGSFLRSIGVPSGIDVEKISANFDKGVLKVTLPKLPEAQTKSKRIEVKPAK